MCVCETGFVSNCVFWEVKDERGEMCWRKKQTLLFLKIKRRKSQTRAKIVGI